MTVVVRHTLAREQGCQYVTLECSVGFLKSLAEPDTHKVDTLLAPDDSTGAETRVLDGVTYLELELGGFTLSTLSRHIHHLALWNKDKGECPMRALHTLTPMDRRKRDPLRTH
jgi:hypothetical protein